MSAFRLWLENTLGLSVPRQGQLLASAIVIAILVLLRWAVLSAALKRVDDARARYRWRKTSMYLAVVAGFLTVGRIWFEGFASLATYLGLLSAGVAIALKDLVANLAGWAFIVWRRPFDVGDRVQVGEHAGDVIDVRIFQFTLLEIGNWVDADQSTGRMIHVPNGRVLSDVVANYTRGFQYIWNEIPVLLTFESNWREAKAILEGIATRHAASVSGEVARQLEVASRQFMIVYKTLTPAVFTSVRDCGVLLTIRYLCDPRLRRMTTEAMWEEILDAFGKRQDIDFAYPTTRYFDNRTEGKPAARS